MFWNTNIYFILVFQVSNLGQISSKPLLCQIAGILLHGFWLMTFLIMTFISLEFCYRFSNVCKPWFVKSGKNKEKVKYCWIVGVLLMAIPVCLERLTNLPLSYASSRGICFIEPHKYVIIFFIGPTLCLISINALCFIVTIYNVRKTVSDEVDIARERNMAIKFAKISGLMGLTWLFALISYVTWMNEMWYIFNVLNGIQGVYIFHSSGIANHCLRMIRSLPGTNSKTKPAPAIQSEPQQSEMLGKYWFTDTWPKNNEIYDAIRQETIIWCHWISGISNGFRKWNSTDIKRSLLLSHSYEMLIDLINEWF